MGTTGKTPNARLGAADSVAADVAADAQSGLTLIEMIVAISVFAIFVAMILGTTVALSQSASRAQITADASNSTLVLFGALDRQARYADSVNAPGTGISGNRYIEFRTPGNSSVSGVTRCTQWRFLPESGRIESRSWDDIPGISAGTNWTTRLSNVIDLGADYPFTMRPARHNGSLMQQLSVKVESGNAHLGAVTEMETTFIARNSSVNSPSNNPAAGTPVCLNTGDRP